MDMNRSGVSCGRHTDQHMVASSDREAGAYPVPNNRIGAFQSYGVNNPTIAMRL